MINKVLVFFVSGNPGIREAGNPGSIELKFFHKISSHRLTAQGKGGNFIMEKFKTYKLAVQFHCKSNNLNLKGPIKNQFQRACLSIVLNLAEGSAKSSRKERKKFYEISLGSLREVQAILTLINHQKLIKEADKLGAFLYKLYRNT